MKKFFGYFFLSIVLYGYSDLGVIGKEYPIEEKNIRIEILNGLKKINPEQIKRDYIRNVEKAFISNISLPVSKRDTSIDYQDVTIVPYDIPNPNMPGTLLHKKGEKFVSNIGQKIKFLCFVDAANNAIAKEVVKEFGACDYLISNRDIRTINYTGKNNVFPMSKAFVERFKVKQLPVKVIMYRDRISHQYLSIPRIVENLKKRGSGL